MTLAADIALLALAGMATVFTLLYVIRSPWEKSELGRIYLAKCAVLSLVLIQISAATWISMDFPGRQPIRLVIYALGAIVYVPMLCALWREQQRDRRRKRKEVAGHE
ncbi:putative phage holin [Rhodococcus sp. BE178]|uniref:putative phage holin n=1 Tax=Rhodococcus sp. BE178 TaxID=2817737 RepID=UPI003D1EED9A